MHSTHFTKKRLRARTLEVAGCRGVEHEADSGPSNDEDGGAQSGVDLQGAGNQTTVAMGLCGFLCCLSACVWFSSVVASGVKVSHYRSQPSAEERRGSDLGKLLEVHDHQVDGIVGLHRDGNDADGNEELVPEKICSSSRFRSNRLTIQKRKARVG